MSDARLSVYSNSRTTSYPGSLGTLVGVGHVPRRFCGVNSKYILGGVAQKSVSHIGNFKDLG